MVHFPISLAFRLFLRHHADMRNQVRTSFERIRDIAGRETTSTCVAEGA